MRLTIGGAQALTDLDDAAIRDEVQRVASLSRRDLDAMRRRRREARREGLSAHVDYGPDPFLILELDSSPEGNNGFMQAHWHPPSRGGDAYGFLLEYTEGSYLYGYFPVSVEETTKAFIEYFHGGDWWKERFDWNRELI